MLTKLVFFEVVDVSNGLSWTPDNQILYYIDSFANSIVANAIDIPTGNLGIPRVVFDLKENEIDGVADGMTIDVDGNLWIAISGGSQVIHVNPQTGKLLKVVKFPSRNITPVTIGGPTSLDILYATSAQHGLSEEQLVEIPDSGAAPAAGALFQVRNTGEDDISGRVRYSGLV